MAIKAALLLYCCSSGKTKQEGNAPQLPKTCTIRMKLWLATTLAAILLSVCSAYPYPFEFDETPTAGMEQGEDTDDIMEALAEDKTPDSVDMYIQDDVSDINFDTRVMDYPEVQALSPTACLQDLYILAFTSGRKGAGSDKAHEVEVRAAGQTKVIKLPNLPGDDYKKNKGDLWKLTFRGDLKFTRCVTLRNLDHIAIEAGSNDGWNIDSIVTFVRAHGSFRLITRNFNAFRWIDGNGPASHRRFKLRNVY